MAMNREVKIRILSQYKWLLDEVAYLKKQKEECRINKLSPRAIEYSGMPKGSGGNSDLSSYAAKIDMYERDIDAMLQTSIEKKRKIMEWIAKLTDTQGRMILVYRYIEGDKIELIAEKMGCVDKTIRVKHREAVEELPDNYEIMEMFGIKE